MQSKSCTMDTYMDLYRGQFYVFLSEYIQLHEAKIQDIHGIQVACTLKHLFIKSIEAVIQIGPFTTE